MKKKKHIPEVPRAQSIVVYDRIFNQKVTVLINQTPESLVRWLNKNNIEDTVGNNFVNFAGWTQEYQKPSGEVFAVIVLPNFKWRTKEQATLIHEITHVIIKIWARNNIPFNPDTQEFLAHSIGRMYEDIAHKLL